MKRGRWVIAGVVSLAVVAVGVWALWPLRPPPSVDRTVIDAYVQRGATYGVMRDRWSGSSDPPALNFLVCDSSEIVAPSSVPAFRFNRFVGVRADELPAVGRPFGLDLSGNQSSAPDLKEVAKFEHLARLDLTETPVTDAGLKHLAGLTSLTHLSLRSTAVTDDGMKHLAGLSNLARLDVRGTKVTSRGLQVVAGLPNMSFLGVDAKQVTDELLSALAAARKLHTLQPFVSGEHGHPVADDSQIVTVHLWGTEVTDDGLRPLTDLANLRSLWMGYTKVTDAGMDDLAPLIRLRVLDLRDTAVTHTGLQHLSRLTNLSELMLADDQVTDEVLALLAAAGRLHILADRVGGVLVPGSTSGDGPNQKSAPPFRAAAATDADIQSLKLSQSKVTDAGLQHLTVLSKLEELDLTGTRVTAEGRMRVREKLPKCRVLP